jgi:hypothetical protein
MNSDGISRRVSPELTELVRSQVGASLCAECVEGDGGEDVDRKTGRRMRGGGARGLREPADEFDLVEGGAAAAAALCGCCREEAGASVVAAGLRGIEVTSGGVDQRPGVEQAVPALQGRVQRSLQKGLSNSIWTPHGGPRVKGRN